MYSSKHFTLLFFLLLTLPIFAQEIKPLNCRFIPLFESPDVLINSGNSNEEVKIEVAKGRISKSYQCHTVDGVLSFLDQERKPFSSVRIPKNIQAVILVLIKTPKTGEKAWKIVPLEDSIEAFPPGGALAVNLHADDIRLIIGETKDTLKSLESKGYKRPTKRNNFNMASVAFQFKNNKNKWVNAKQTSYRFTETKRYLLLAYIDPTSKRPAVKTFKDAPRFSTPDSTVEQ